MPAPKTALITGAARGMGRVFASRLARHGTSIVAVDVLDLGDTVAEVTALGARVLAVRADLSDHQAVRGIARQLGSEFEGIDVLINNAGLHPRPVPIEEVDFDYWRKTMAVNVDAMFLLIQAFTPYMKSAGWGRIVNLSSSSVNTAPAMGGAYVASKAAVLGLTRTVAAELGPFGITVNAVAPNPVRTPGAQVPLSDEMFEAIAAMQPIPRVVGIDDVAGVVEFLCSDMAAMITGQHIHVDGGMVFGS